MTQEHFRPSDFVSPLFKEGTEASYPVLPGQCKIIRIKPGDQVISTIGAAAGPTTVFVARGNGI